MPRAASAINSDILNTAQVAEWLNVPPATLRNWRHHDTGPASFKLNGGRVVYRRRSVELWLAAQEMSTRRGGVE